MLCMFSKGFLKNISKYLGSSLSEEIRKVLQNLENVKWVQDCFSSVETFHFLKIILGKNTFKFHPMRFRRRKS